MKGKHFKMFTTARRQSVPKDGSWHGRIEVGGQFPPENDRYHLYIGLFCPFAHRVNLIRHLKGLTSILPISIVKPYPKRRYILDDQYKQLDFYPENLATEIDEMGEWMQSDINYGVYKAGFASDQEEYDRNVVSLFKALNRIEEIIKKNGGPYVLGSELTELDLRLYPTICRFDAVYVQHFKCNLGTIRHNYPVLNAWLKYLYWGVEGFKETTDFKHIKENGRIRLKDRSVCSLSLVIFSFKV
ncbi:hypothetical protein DID88_006697 [Monilinia fructigena]|uniref:GST C-terminal domain-containing protein n=1 Tax=Monilinia fructigena TaxID=38457 RepID=A0A395IG53_9HELO|nr:hypothetical protein DID88_006697 [Monilinia fructigena]